jgi:hypothetical protein
MNDFKPYGIPGGKAPKSEVQVMVEAFADAIDERAVMIHNLNKRLAAIETREFEFDKRIEEAERRVKAFEEKNVQLVTENGALKNQIRIFGTLTENENIITLNKVIA